MSEEHHHQSPDISEQFEGFDATFGTHPNEIYIRLRTGSPAYIRVIEGNFIREGDADHWRQLGENSPTLDEWEVTEITPDSIIAQHTDSHEEIQWDRDRIEKGLAIGQYSTNLTDFETISVYRVGRWRDYNPDAPEEGTKYTDRPYVAVVAYGNNGLKYGRRYRIRSADTPEIELWKEDLSRDDFDDETLQQLDYRIRQALTAEGYEVSD